MWRQCCDWLRARPGTRQQSGPIDRQPRNTLALRYASGLAPAVRAEILERQAHESFLADQFDVSIASGREAVEQFHASGDQLREGDALRQLSSHLRCAGYTAEEAQARGGKR